MTLLRGSSSVRAPGNTNPEVAASTPPPPPSPPPSSPSSFRMSSRLLKVYHRLPPKARSAVATLRGWYLLRSRYGKGSAALSAEARERDEWTPQQWKTWVEERVAYMLHRAATRVPYYRNLGQERRRRGDRAAWDVLAHWPLLEK